MKSKTRPHILFVYDMEPAMEYIWDDGLRAALNVLTKDFQVQEVNLKRLKQSDVITMEQKPEFILGWGAFGGPVDGFMQSCTPMGVPLGLCLAGYATPKFSNVPYSVIFYETQWSLNWLKQYLTASEPHYVHAFGVNTDIFKPALISRYAESFPIWDYMTVGAFSAWKRQGKILFKPGLKLAVGQIQKDNLAESMDIVLDLVVNGVTVSDMVPPKTLAHMYHMSKHVYIPAEVIGGGERATLEARACEIPVEVEADNLKLQELLTCPVWDHKYYAYQLKQGILSCIK